ncbi:hypothetical protein LTR12_009508 [Friedmanniomyces endolithicus]|nr:hypothetical protein LTR74_011636 [Friedmanniomyces endolithicus]KAK1816086.1 hypothetical protein LTR12_009508 [Friedmanniomyces endolithicus]
MIGTPPAVIIGDKWKGESEEVREIYKRKAEDVKRQHELNHPDYQYQPRKPSAKKRRMTETKLAKLAKAQAEANGYVSEQQSLTDDFDPATLLDQSLGAHTASHSMQLANFGPDHTAAQPLIHDSVHNGLSQFKTGPGLEDRLLASLQEFNEHAPAQNAPNAATFAGNNNAGALWNFAARRAPGQQTIPPNIIEVLRQDALEEMFSKYTYVGALVDSPSPSPSPAHVGPASFDVDVTITSDAAPPATTSVPDIAMPEIGNQGGAQPQSVSEPEPGPANPYVPQPTYASGPQFTDDSEPQFPDMASLFGLDDFDLIFDDGMTEDFMTDA